MIVSERQASVALYTSTRVKQARFRGEMQEGLRERAQAGRPRGKRNPGPFNHPFQNRAWLESSTVKTVSKEAGNKSKQGQVFLFLMHLTIALPQTVLLTVQIKALRHSK